VSDAQLRQDIMDEFTFDPRFSGEHIGVAVNDGVVSLSGHVASYGEKLAAIAAARRVRGVHAIAEAIEVRQEPASAATDEQIASRAAALLAWNSTIRPDTVDVIVHDGWITLNGSVEWYYERVAAEDAVRRLSGVRGVTNDIVVRPRVSPSDIKSRIEAALRRYAANEADLVGISVHDGNKVILEGDVGSWSERHAIETAAWLVPGVVAVDDRLRIKRKA
jgi:osmotically-inducible protein OsmY